MACLQELRVIGHPFAAYIVDPPKVHCTLQLYSERNGCSKYICTWPPLLTELQPCYPARFKMANWNFFATKFSTGVGYSSRYTNLECDLSPCNDKMEVFQGGDGKAHRAIHSPALLKRYDSEIEARGRAEIGFMQWGLLTLTGSWKCAHPTQAENVVVRLRQSRFLQGQVLRASVTQQSLGHTRL